MWFNFFFCAPKFTFNFLPLLPFTSFPLSHSASHQHNNTAKPSLIIVERGRKIKSKKSDFLIPSLFFIISLTSQFLGASGFLCRFFLPFHHFILDACASILPVFLDGTSCLWVLSSKRLGIVWKWGQKIFGHSVNIHKVIEKFWQAFWIMVIVIA